MRSSDRSYKFRILLAAVLAALDLLFLFPVSSSASAADADTEQYAREIALLVNEARQSNGLPPMYVSPYLNSVAMIRAQESAVLLDEKHRRPDGTKWSTVIDRNIAPYSYAAENLAASASDPAQVMSLWQSSPKHWAAILSQSATHMGVGVLYDPSSPHRWYWLLDMIQYSGDDGVMEGQYIPQRYTVVPKSCGDVNGDGVVDTFDYVSLTAYLENKGTAGQVVYNDLQLEAADCLRDGQVTVADAKALQRYLLGEYTALPYEF